jgi:acetyl esterase/lipase
MTIDRRLFIGAALGMALAPAATRAEQWGDPPTPYAPGPGQPVWPPAEHFALWPGRPPGAPDPLPVLAPTMNGPHERRELWLRGVAEPMVAVFRPARPDGRAVLIIPGGGYNFVSVHNEGIDVASTLTPHGITCFVLAYRLPGEGWANRADVALQDAQRAMRLIRARAATWRIDRAKLGLIGFSAGGHLGLSLAVGHSDPVYAPVDDADRLPARPAYAGIAYPAVHGFAAFWGDSPSADVQTRYTTLPRVVGGSPPFFLAHAMDDPVVPIQNSLDLIAVARFNHVPVEAHLFETGGHGFGALHLPEGSSGRLWPESFARWTAARV